MSKDFAEQVDAMAGLGPAKPKDGGHPWWNIAYAVKELIDSGDFPEAVEYMEGVYNDRR